MRSKFVWLDVAVLVLLTAALIAPLFKLDYLDNWPSIEGTFVSDSRMLADHLPHPGWQPLWYCGTRFDYIYPPLIRYGPALISRYAHVSAARAHHSYTAVLYVIGIVGVYVLFLIGSGSRAGALLAGAACALVSPSFFLIKEIRDDSLYWVPQKLHTLMLYGEGPHVSAVCLLPFALAASWRALERWRPAWFGVAALMCALLVSHNFYGATGLAIIFPILAWSMWVATGDRRVWLRAAGIAALAWGLCAVWLTPSYVRITLIDLKWVAQPGHKWSRVVVAIAAWAFCELSYRFAARRRERAWTVFVIGCGVIVGIWVIGFFHLDLRVTGEHGRLVPELDIVLAIVFIEAMRRLWKWRAGRIPAIALTLALFIPAAIYVPHAWQPFPSSGPLPEQYEYGITKWVSENLPGERVFAVGTVRFWYDTWYDNAQPDGGSLQGMLNQNLVQAYWEITADDDPQKGMLWLQALGADAVIVPDQNSRETFHDMQHPENFKGRYAVLHDDGKGTVIYRVPRRSPGIARVIDATRLRGIETITSENSVAMLSRYTAAVEDPAPGTARVAWRGTDAFEVETKVRPGESLLLQETYDPAWRARVNGRAVAIHPDPLSFMLVDLPPGSHKIELRFETPFENRLGAVLTLLSLITVVALIARGVR